VLAEVVLLDDDVRPDSSYERRFVHELAGVLGEIEEQIECARLQRDDRTAARKLLPARVETEITELVDDLFRCHGSNHGNSR
jgi:hypothetical protein